MAQREAMQTMFNRSAPTPATTPRDDRVTDAPIPKPIAPPQTRTAAPEPRCDLRTAADARNDRLQGPPAPPPPGALTSSVPLSAPPAHIPVAGGGSGPHSARRAQGPPAPLPPASKSPNPTRPGMTRTLTGSFEPSNKSKRERPVSSISSGGPSPRGDEKKKGDGKEGGSKIRRKGKFLRKRKEKTLKEGDLEAFALVHSLDSSSFETDTKFKPHDMHFTIVSEEEMFTKEREDENFRIYVICEEKPGCYFECTFPHPMTISKVVSELCIKFQLGIGKNLATLRMHIMSPNDNPETVTVLGPAHKGGDISPSPSPTPPGAMGLAPLPPGELGLADDPSPRVKGTPPPVAAGIPPALPERDGDRRMSVGEEGERKDWKSVLRTGKTPFLLHTAMHICVDEIQKVMDERDQPYVFLMMKSQVSQKADLLDIYKDDEWEGSHEHYFWGPLLQTEEVPETVVDMDCEKKGWRLEPGGNRKIMVSSTMQQIKAEPGIPRIPLYLVSSPYASFFYDKAHDNYYAETDGCPIVVSVEKNEDNKNTKNVKMLVRSDQGDVRSRVVSPNLKEISKVLANIRPNLSGLKLKKIANDAALQKLLLNYETHTELPRKMKFGILCIKPGQVIDDEMFANQNGSKYYDEFLEFLGDKITLKGWEGYRGGLDVNNNTTGEYGLYTKYSDVDIMFHVSTLLPFDVADTQHLERKRHLGNDVACIAFMDPGEEGEEGNLLFQPDVIASHFIHVWMVVSVNKALTAERGKTVYNVEVVNKAGVKPFEPFLTGEPFEKNEKTRKVILTKLINGEITALAAPQFMHSDSRTRTQLLQEMVKEIQAKN